MALPDLTGQNIQNTYQRVLQTDGGTLRDGTGSLVDHITVDGTGSFGRLICTTISASTGDFDANTIFIGGTSFNKGDLDDLKEGKTINTVTKDLGEGDTGKANIIRPEAVMHPNDNTTYSKYTTTGRIGTFVSGTLFHDLNLNGSNNNITMGNGTTNLTLSGSINEATLDGGTF